MRLPLYQVDAFANAVFGGNPAAVVPLETWPTDAVLQAIATENNLSETAFFAREDAGWRLRWFTPTVEIDLCGHATLASAFVIFSRIAPEATGVAFATRSGELRVTRDGERLAMDFPAIPARPLAGPEAQALADMLGAKPVETWLADRYMAVYAREEDVAAVNPDMARLAATGKTAIITAPGRAHDFVSRFFAPSHGVPEDPVTGSAHCVLTPYWARRLGKSSLRARQISRRGGELLCEDRGARVSMAGKAVLYLEGTIGV